MILNLLYIEMSVPLFQTFSDRQTPPLTFPEMKSAACCVTVDVKVVSFWVCSSSKWQEFVLAPEVILFSMIIDGSVTSPNSKIKVVILRKSSDLRKTKNEDTPVPKRPAEQRDKELGSNVIWETIFYFISFVTCNIKILKEIVIMEALNK